MVRKGLEGSGRVRDDLEGPKRALEGFGGSRSVGLDGKVK